MIKADATGTTGKQSQGLEGLPQPQGTGQYQGSPVTSTPGVTEVGTTQATPVINTPLPERTPNRAPLHKLPEDEYEELAEELDSILWGWGHDEWINWPEVLKQTIPDGKNQTFFQRFGINAADLSGIQKQLKDAPDDSQPYYWLLVVIQQSLSKNSSTSKQEHPGHRYLLYYLQGIQNMRNIGDEASTLIQSFPKHPFLDEKLGFIATRHGLNECHYNALTAAIGKSLITIKKVCPAHFEKLIPLLQEQGLWDNNDSQHLTVDPTLPHSEELWKEQFMGVLKGKGLAISLCIFKALQNANMGKSCWEIMRNVDYRYKDTLVKALYTSEDELDSHGPQRKEEYFETVYLDNRLWKAWHEKAKYENDLRAFCLRLPTHRFLTLEQRPLFLNKAKELIVQSEQQGPELARHRNTKKFWDDLYHHPLVTQIEIFEGDRDGGLTTLKQELMQVCRENQKNRQQAKPSTSLPKEPPKPESQGVQDTPVVREKTETEIRDEVKKEVQEKTRTQGKIIRYLRNELNTLRAQATEQCKQAQLRTAALEIELISVQDQYHKAQQQFIQEKGEILQSLAKQHLTRLDQLNKAHSEKLKSERMRPGTAHFPCNICYEHENPDNLKVFTCCARLFCHSCTEKLRGMAEHYGLDLSCPLCRSELTSDNLLPATRLGDAIFVPDEPAD